MSRRKASNINEAKESLTRSLKRRLGAKALSGTISVGTSYVGNCDPHAPDEEKDKRCLVVLVYERLPEKLRMDKHRKGFRVFWRSQKRPVLYKRK